MKHRVTEPSPVPEHLTTFEAAEWVGHVPDRDWPPADHPSWAFDSWRTAREDWAARHGWPDGEAAQVAEQLMFAALIPDAPWNQEAL